MTKDKAMNIDGKKLWLRVRFVISWILSGLFIRLPRWYGMNKKNYIQMMWVNYQMPTLEEAKGKRIVFLKNVVKKIVKNHYDNRLYPWWTFLAVDIANAIVFIIALANIGKVWTYAMSFIPAGMEMYFYIAFPLLTWIAIEIAQSKWGFNFFWYAHWHTAGIGEGTWYTIDGVATTAISRILKSMLVLGGTWATFQAIDPREGKILLEVFYFYWPLIVITTSMYVLESLGFYMSLMLNTITGWLKMITVGAGMLYAYQAYRILSHISLPQWKEEWNRTTSTVYTYSPSAGALSIWHYIVYYGPRIIVAIAVIYIVYRYWNIIRGVQSAGRILEDDNEGNVFDLQYTSEVWKKVFSVLCWTPTLTVLLIGSTFGYRYYTEIYLPDKMALLATAIYQASEVPTEAPIATEAPIVIEPTMTLVVLPTATDTWTEAPVWTATLPATATETPIPTDTPTSTPTGSYTQDQNGSPVLVQDMTLPDVTNPWKRIGCGNAIYQVGVVPDSQPVCTNDAAIFKKDGWPLYVLLKVQGSRASFQISGDGAPVDTVCTLNGEQFGLSGNVKVSTGNVKSRLECPKIGLTAIAW